MEFDVWLQNLIEEQNSKPETNEFLLTRIMESAVVPMFALYHEETQLMSYMREKDIYFLYDTLKQWVDNDIEEKNIKRTSEENKSTKLEGKIAVIPGCQHCPYKAFDSSMGIINQEDGSHSFPQSEVAFCGYHLGKDSYDPDNRHGIIIDPYLQTVDGNYDNLMKSYPSEWNKLMPDNCPLPLGRDTI